MTEPTQPPQGGGTQIQLGAQVEPLPNGQPGVVLHLGIAPLQMRFGPLTPDDAEAVMASWMSTVQREVANARRLASGLIVGQNGHGGIPGPLGRPVGLPPDLQWPPPGIAGR